LLAECLDYSGDFGYIDSFDELIDCCNFNRDCERDLEDVQECLDGCIDNCISDDAKESLDCIRDETGDTKCELSDCLDSFLADNIENDIGISGSGDIFYLRSIEKRVEKIDGDIFDLRSIEKRVEKINAK
jgi:hypothetical protein